MFLLHLPPLFNNGHLITNATKLKLRFHLLPHALRHNFPPRVPDLLANPRSARFRSPNFANLHDVCCFTTIPDSDPAPCGATTPRRRVVQTAATTQIWTVKRLQSSPYPKTISSTTHPASLIREDRKWLKMTEDGRSRASWCLVAVCANIETSRDGVQGLTSTRRYSGSLRT